MKKFAMLAITLIIMGTSSVSKAAAGDTILLYIPNRICDMMDMFSTTLGFGPAIGIQGQVTSYCSLGGEVGATAQMIKAINRQYGFAVENGWDASFLMISSEQRERDDSIGSVKDYYCYSTGVPIFRDNQLYDTHNGAKDFWAVGGKLAAMIQIRVSLHPIEIADFFLGWFFIDIKDDDFTADDLD